MDDEREAMVMFAAVLEELQRIGATLDALAGLIGKKAPHSPEPSPVIEPESHGPSACADEIEVSIEKNFLKNNTFRPFSKEEAEILFGKAPSFYPNSRAQASEQLSDLDTQALKVKLDYYGAYAPAHDETPYYFPGLKLDLE